jgi:hypothetical protein
VPQLGNVCPKALDESLEPDVRLNMVWHFWPDSIIDSGRDLICGDAELEFLRRVHLQSDKVVRTRVHIPGGSSLLGEMLG